MVILSWESVCTWPSAGLTSLRAPVAEAGRGGMLPACDEGTNPMEGFQGRF